MRFFRSFLRNESGATAIEYGLIAAGIAVVIIAAVTSVGGRVQAEFNKVNGAVGQPAVHTETDR